MTVCQARTGICGQNKDRRLLTLGWSWPKQQVRWLPKQKSKLDMFTSPRFGIRYDEKCIQQGIIVDPIPLS